jgi:hypothetical protein
MTAADTPPPAAPPPGKRPWYRNRWLIGGAAALGVYTLAGFFLVPYLVRHYVPKIAAETFQRQAAIGEVRFNPFLFRLEASDFAFRDTGGEPMLAIERLLVDFEVSSLARWAWTFAEIRVEGPALDLVIGEDNRLNLARVLDAMPPADPAEPPREGPLPRMVIAQATLAGGKVSFTDRSNPTHATATLEPVDLDFKEISTLPERRGPYAVTARLPGGGSVAWQGEVSLHPVASSGTVRVEGFKPATAWKFLQDRVRLTEPKGDLDVAVTYRFAYAAGVTTLTADPIKASVRDLSATAAPRRRSPATARSTGRRWPKTPPYRSPRRRRRRRRTPARRGKCGSSPSAWTTWRWTTRTRAARCRCASPSRRAR